MFRIFAQLSRTQFLVHHSAPRILYNLSSSVLQQNQDRNINDSLVNELTRDVQKKRKAKKPQLPDNPRKVLIKKLKHFFNCSEDKASMLVRQNESLLKVPKEIISRNIEILFENKVTANTIIDNAWLLGLSASKFLMATSISILVTQSQTSKQTNPSLEYLEDKIRSIEKMQPRDINDFVPLIHVSASILSRTRKTMEKERGYVPGGNRIYYFSSRLEVEPVLVAKYFATHMFMFEVAWEHLEENLNVMLEYKVSSIDILRDLWAFKYLPSSIRARLERCQKADKGNLKPWMIRCTEEILERTLTLSQESKNLLGDSTVIDYLSERLGYDIETTKSIVSRHEQVMKVRVTRVRLFYCLQHDLAFLPPPSCFLSSFSDERHSRLSSD